MNMLILVGVILVALLAVFQGFTWSRMTQGFKVQESSKFTVAALAMCIHQLMVTDAKEVMSPSSTPVYLGTPGGLVPAGAVYAAVLNGVKSIVIEPFEEANGSTIPAQF